jgi:heavy metal sensor kinase
MTITNRLSLFFLLTLGLVLAGFSAALYFLAGVHMEHRTEEWAIATLNTLSAAAEVSKEGVEWEPGERHLNLPREAFGGPILWVVSDDRGRWVDQSASAPGYERFLKDILQRLDAGKSSVGEFRFQDQDWRVRQLRLAGTAPTGRNKDEHKYATLDITVAVSLEPRAEALRQLAAVLIGLSLTVWLIALFVGRVLCRRALRPVGRLADSARDMDAADLGRRMPIPATGDELEDLSKAFNNLLDRLQESVERQQRFTGEASHQLRTPLTAMLGQLEVALRRQRPVEEYEQVLTTVRYKAEHLRRIVESLLFLTRADADARLPDREHIDLHEWVPAHLRSWSEHPRAADLLTDAVGATGAQVEVQSVLLGELVNLLLDNACKYSSPGKPIMVRLRCAGPFVELSVQDEGCGISPEEQRHLFTPFFRSADARRRGVEGLGLGLAIAKRVADAFHGELTVTSQPGHGSCFTLRLPALGRSKQLDANLVGAKPTGKCAV